jgi:photosystem II stability/assembly factor-like uncharacterized protein
MAKAARKGSSNGRPAAKGQGALRPRLRVTTVVWIALAVGAAVTAFLIAKQQATSGSVVVQPPPRGLPHTPDYHSLLVSATDAQHVFLGTHAGLYESRDGGRTWRVGAIESEDVMNLVRTRAGVLWAAGHYVLERSTDDGRTWRSPDVEGLPSRDIHGFAADPADARVLYAAVAGKGLYRSQDGGRSFAHVSEDVGGDVFGLQVVPPGRILAADPGRRAVLASDDGGRTWRVALRADVIGLAANRARPAAVLATGGAVYRSRDGGRAWRKVLRLPSGPVAWATSRPSVAYLIGPERTLYRTEDGGSSWQPVR